MKSLKSVFIFVFILCTFFAYSFSYDDAWKSLDTARLKFEEGDIGQALKYAENAKEIRKNESTAALTSLENALKPLAVQEVGDLIPDVEEILTERMENDALKYIHKLTDLYGNSYFNNSVTKIKNFYQDRAAYPEADYLIAKIYMQEGEYSSAADYYEKALANKDVLDVPDEKYDIMYDAAELARLRKDEVKFQNYLNQILKDNDRFSDGEKYTAYLKAIVRYSISRQADSIDKLFLLYRSNHYKSLNALLKLTEYYISNNEYERAYYTCILSVLTSFTRIYEIITARNQKYTYTTLDLFFKEALKYRDVKEWMNKNNVWRGFYNFGVLLSYDNYSPYEDIWLQSNKQLAEQLFEVIKNSCPDKTIVNLIKKATTF
ncbi:MAG: hypothetical protein J5647_03330 [Spirochaetaceae bacterium]|nr:hypothetical protein [Spirochaetaceae bacterium]